MRNEEIDVCRILNKLRKHISLAVKEARIKKGWDIQDLAFYSRLSEKTVYNIEERGDANITLKTLLSLSLALEINVEELIASVRIEA